jgi:sugar phosphate isomerase/epimerase
MLPAVVLRLGMFSGALREWPPEQIAAAAARAGLEAVEWEVGTGDRAHIPIGSLEQHARRCATASEKAGVSVSTVCGDASLSILSAHDVASLLAACSAVGATRARMFAPAPVGGTPVRSQLDSLRLALHDYRPMLEAGGLTLLIELSQGTLLPSPELFLRVCSGLPPACCGILYDPANMLEEGNLEPGFAIDLMGEYLCHVHMKNERFVRGPGGWSAEIVEADHGLVEWPSVFRELERAGYAGEVVIDHLSGPVDEARFRSDVETARRLWDARHLAERD